jgi:hypothetical protein
VLIKDPCCGEAKQSCQSFSLDISEHTGFSGRESGGSDLQVEGGTSSVEGVAVFLGDVVYHDPFAGSWKMSWSRILCQWIYQGI